MPVYKNIQQHKLLLDTHVWIWLMMGDAKLKPSFRKAIKTHSEKEHLYLSAISIWEFGMLVERGRINLEIDALDWVEESLEGSGIDLLPITPRIAIQSTRLPESPHGDPADRILLATAQRTSSNALCNGAKTGWQDNYELVTLRRVGQWAILQLGST